MFYDPGNTYGDDNPYQIPTTLECEIQSIRTEDFRLPPGPFQLSKPSFGLWALFPKGSGGPLEAGLELTSAYPVPPDLL